LKFANRFIPLFCATFVFVAGPTAAQETKSYEPYSGQPGKDVVWVPTPDALVEKMLDMAAVTPQDFVMDLGSGDGRMVIAAAKRGVRALGVEYEEKMVELARRRAAESGVGDRASFVQGDMFEADVSKASVLALFLLTENLDRLASKFLDMTPGSRIVLNHYLVTGWAPDHSENIPDCTMWCTAHLYIVPAKAEGTWKLGEETLVLKQDFQNVSGMLVRGERALPVTGRLRGDRISFTADDTRYEGRVNGNEIVGEKVNAQDGRWAAIRARTAN